MEDLVQRFIDDERLFEITRSRIALPATGLRYSTALAYLGILKRHILPQWRRFPIESIHPSMVQEWLEALPLAPKTRAHIKALMHRLYEKAMLWEAIDVQRNPMELVELRGASRRLKRPIVLTVEHFQAVLARLSEPFRTMVVVALCLGLRRSEVCGLQWRDLDFANESIRITRSIVNGRIENLKTEYSHSDLPLAPKLIESLLEWRVDCPPTAEGWVFPNRSTLKPYHPSEITKRYLRPIGEDIGIGHLGWHTFRHTYRSWMDVVGAPVGVQQKLMRHAQVSTTMDTYGDALMSEKRTVNSKVVRMVLPSESMRAVR